MAVTMKDRGLGVVTQDGTVVGTVKEISGSYFKVDAPKKRDFWLAGDLVSGRDAQDRLLLDLSRADLAGRERSEPGLEPEEDPMAEILGTPMIPEDELLRQRARMEEEMAEQSVAMANSGSAAQERGAHLYEQIPSDHAAFSEHAGEFVPNHALLHYQEMLQSGTGSKWWKPAGLVAAGFVLGIAVVTGLQLYRGHHQASAFEKPLQRGAQLLRRSHLRVRNFRV